jgi:capsular exopolysaccharide synthesis family protein
MANQQLNRSLDEHYRALHQRVRSLLTGVDSSAVGITSCMSGEGVTTVAAQLAKTAALDQEVPVLLIDANIHGAGGSGAGGSGAGGSGAGLADLMASDPTDATDWKTFLRSTFIDNLSYLPSGATTAATTFTADRFQQLLEQFRKDYPWIIVDLPPAGALNDCLTFSTNLDGVLLVVEAERARNQVVRRVKEQLLQSRSTILGVVFNKRKNHVPDWLYRRL